MLSKWFVAIIGDEMEKTFSQQNKNVPASHLLPSTDFTCASLEKFNQPICEPLPALKQDRITQSDIFGHESNLRSWLGETMSPRQPSGSHLSIPAGLVCLGHIDGMF